MPSPHYTRPKDKGQIRRPGLSLLRLFHSLRPKVVKQQAEVCLCPYLIDQTNPGFDPHLFSNNGRN